MGREEKGEVMENSSTFLAWATRKSAGSGVEVRKGDAEFSFRNDESEVPIGPPCEYSRLDSRYYSLKRKSGWE